jgi:hypothetical protein
MRSFLPLPHARASIFISLLLAVFISSADAFAQNTPPSDQKSGSILFFAQYTSDTVDPMRENTQIHITNTDVMGDVDVDLYFVDGSTCSVANARATLLPNQTASFLASDIDPGVVGYIVAVANLGGVPVWFNNLVGDAYIRKIDGQVAMLPAVAVSRVSHRDVELATESSADLIFDGSEYERLPQVVVASSFNSQITHDTTLVTYVPTPNLGFSVNKASTITTLVYDDTGRVRSTSLITRCYRRTPLSSLRMSEDLNDFVKAGRTGWIKMMTTGELPLLGAIFTSGPLFNGALNFRHISMLKTYTITVPVI